MVKVTRPLYSTAALKRQAAAAVSVGTYWPWEPTATLRSALCRRGRLGGARRFGAHRGGEGRGILWRPPAYSLLSKSLMQNLTLWYVNHNVKTGVKLSLNNIYIRFNASAYYEHERKTSIYSKVVIVFSYDLKFLTYLSVLPCFLSLLFSALLVMGHRHKLCKLCDHHFW